MLNDRPDPRGPEVPPDDLPPVQAIEDLDQVVRDYHVERVRPGATDPGPIRLDASYPDPMDRPDGGPRLPEMLHAGGLIPEVVPPLPRESLRARNLPWSTAFSWLAAGWRDLWRNPGPSLLYGLIMFAVSVLVILLLFRQELGFLILPALAGFLALGPLAACGLYEKSRRLEADGRAGFRDVFAVRPRSAGSALFLGVLLMGLFLLWIRAAVLLYALFFGLTPFPGFEEVVPRLFTTPRGWALLGVGSVVGALFAAFAFATSALSFPMLLEERTDALSAMGISTATVWTNLALMLAWGAIVLGLFALAVLTGGLGFVLAFPVLGHGTWHAYRALRPEERQGGESERMFVRPA